MFKFFIFPLDVPSVRITVDPQTNVENIREGDDVFFTCSINAVPPVTSISWYHNVSKTQFYIHNYVVACSPIYTRMVSNVYSKRLLF